MLVERKRHLHALQGLLQRHPVVGILGARQVGKTTLAQQLVATSNEPVTIFDLENPQDLARLEEPLLGLRNLEGLVILDEVQRRPDVFPVLRVLVDRQDSPARFLVLGSASPELLQQSSESLAGRIYYHELGGFALDEIDPSSLERLWLRGGFPRSYLAKSTTDAMEWRRAFVRTYLERDLPQFGVRVPFHTLYRFWSMLAHYHAQIWNGAELARAFGIAATTVRRYLDLLSSTLMVRQLPAWFENLSKRQVKSPKIYIADSGLLHTLFDITDSRDLENHPKVGASWEGFALSEIITRIEARSEECFYWATHSGAELDLLIVRGNLRLGFEFKRTLSPKLTRSSRQAISDLRLDRLDIVHAGDDTFELDSNVRALALKRLLDDLGPLS